MGLSAAFLIGTASLGIFSCDAPGERQRTGAILGAIAGGVIGARANDDNRTTGAVVGALAGAAAGSFIGCRLQMADQRRLAADGDRAVATGQGSEWRNPETGITGKTEVATTTESSRQSVRLAEQVQAPRGLVLAGSTRTAQRDIVLRAGPDARARVLGGFGEGEAVDLLGTVRGRDGASWAAVHRSGELAGYVPIAALSTDSTAQIASRGSAPSRQPPAARPSGGRAPVEVQMTTTCRLVTQTVTSGGKPEQRQVKVCAQPDGNWREA